MGARAREALRDVDANKSVLYLTGCECQGADMVGEHKMLNLSRLQTGDEVEVDFIVPRGHSNMPLTASTVRNLEPVTP